MRLSFRNGFVPAALLGLSSTLVGCAIVGGSGVPYEISHDIDTTGVDTLSVCCGLEVHAVQGTGDTVTINGDDNLVDDVVVRVVGDRVEVRWRDESITYNPSLPMVVELELPELVLLESSGGSRVEFGPVESTDLVVNQSGGGNSVFESVAADSLRVDTSGGGSFELPELDVASFHLVSSGGSVTTFGGTAPEASFEVSGGGQILAFSLATEDAAIILSGGSVAELSVTDTLTGDASGGSVVTLRGNADIDVVLSGGSTITPD